jgi:hypothetical protein
VRLSRDPAKPHAWFDDPNLVSRAGLIPVMALAGRCGLADLAGEYVKVARRTGTASLAAEAISTARQAGCTGKIVFRIDSAYYSAAVLGAIRGGACFSVTVRTDPNIRAAIAAIPGDAWTSITYRRRSGMRTSSG